MTRCRKAQIVLLTDETWFQSQDSPHRTSGGRSGTRTTWAVPCQDRSRSAPYWFCYYPRLDDGAITYRHDLSKKHVTCAYTERNVRDCWKISGNNDWWTQPADCCATHCTQNGISPENSSTPLTFVTYSEGSRAKFGRDTDSPDQRHLNLPSIPIGESRNITSIRLQSLDSEYFWSIIQQ
jgi:hypothetical protein